MPKQDPHELDAYQPDYSPARGTPPPAPPPPGRASVGFFGCLRDSIAVLVLGAVVAALLGGTYWYLVVRETTDTTESFLDRIFGSGDEVIQVDTRQVVLAVQQEAWLETVRETQYVDVSARIGMPSPLPGTRSMRYAAFVTITGGVDMQTITEEDLEIDGDTLLVTLPNAQLRDCILDIDASRFYDQSCNMVGCGNLEDILIQNAYEAAATQDIDRIINQAFENAVEYMQELGENLGFDTVMVRRDAQAISPYSDDGTCSIYAPDPAEDTNP